MSAREGAGLGPADHGEATRLVQVGGDLGQELVVAEADGDGDGELVLHPPREPRERRRRARPVKRFGAREVHEGLVDGEWLHQRRTRQHQRADLATHRRVLLHVGPDDGRLGAGLERLEHGHGGAHAVGPGDIAAGGDHAPVAPADDHGAVAQLRPVALLDGGVEGVAVEMGDGEAVKLRVAQDARRPAGRAGAGTGVRPMAAIAAERVHGAIIGLDRGRAKMFVCDRMRRRERADRRAREGGG